MRMFIFYGFLILFLLILLATYTKNPLRNDVYVLDNKDMDKLNREIQIKMEWAYFQGQKDAIEDDLRIEKLNDSIWVWSHSPWDGGKEPILTELKD